MCYRKWLSGSGDTPSGGSQSLWKNPVIGTKFGDNGDFSALTLKIVI